MPVLLARVDDRLVHGQVVHGWGRSLDATFFAIVSDELRADPERAELYLFAVPDGAAGVNGGWLGVAIVTPSEGDHAEASPSESVAFTVTSYVPACVQAWLAEAVATESSRLVVEVLPSPQ